MPDSNQIKSISVQTARQKTRVLAAGKPSDSPVLLLHGNTSSGIIWKEVLEHLSNTFYCIAPDLRGYGESDKNQIINSEEGVLNWVYDIEALADHFEFEKFHLAGHSLGGWICWGVLSEMPERIKSVTLMAPGPPYGFGGTTDEAGTPVNEDFSGTGAGAANQKFLELLKKGEKEISDPMFSPRAVMNRMFWKEGFKPAREEEILDALLSVHTGEKQYPGDSEKSEFWPGFKPGKFGPANAISPKNNRELLSRILRHSKLPPLLWIHGKDDDIVSDTSLSDPAYQGVLGFRDGWPGDEIYPPQPMIRQIQFLMDKISKVNTHNQIEWIDDCGHTPFLEKKDTVIPLFKAFIVKMDQ